ncbi:hypothetical protein [Echinimonas agarilytica]|uniref:Uncharacterized protein n=1 Tax=Echinimonas agarilytica TaxID=1215918 RepID=A0AA42B8X0_9GAMM|nr:hypothetical protein [Echinimonas agarilytica]MCM2681489.1 hypothetical protein [Echinimonas agarilytica]
MSVFKQYIIVMAGAFVGLASMLMAFNYHHDIHFLYHFGEVSSYNRGYEREFKPWHVRNAKPEVVVIGNSRPLYSFDTTRISKKNSYNFAIAGANTWETVRNFEHILYTSAPKLVFLSVDNVCSNIADKTNVHVMGNALREMRAHYYRILALLNTEAFNAWLTDKLPSNDELYDRSGRRTRFESNRTMAEGFRFRENNKIKNRFKSQWSESCNVRAITRLLTLAHENNVDLKMFINPIHIRYIEVDHQFKYTEQLLNIRKKRFVELNELVAQQFGKKPFTIYDFLEINDVTTEFVDLSSTDFPKYWYESSHYKKNVGDMMIDRMMSNRPEGGTAFGTEINTSNIDAHIQQQWALLSEWRTKSPHVVNDIRQSMERIGQELGKQVPQKPN